jgi:hypothetical protein
MAYGAIRLKFGLIVEFPNREPIAIALADIAGDRLKSPDRDTPKKPAAARVRPAATRRTKGKAKA